MNKLKAVALHITEKCSHDCSYCYYRKAKNTVDYKDDRTFPLQTLKSITDELNKNKVEEIYFLGGDPAEHPQILELAEYSHNNKLMITSVSNTHNYKCTPQELIKYITIYESTIHGHTMEFHDQFCKSPGAYENVLSRLSLYHNLGCDTGITLNIMPSNAGHLHDAISNILNTYGNILDYINIQRIAPMGRAKIQDNYYLCSDDMLLAFSQIEKIETDFQIEIQCEDAFPLCLLPKKYWKYVHRCEWGYQKLSINGNGHVSRCGANPQYNLGNLLNTPLAKIWEESKILNEFRRKQFLSDTCKKCSHLDICGGGCVLGCWSGTEFGIDYLLQHIS